MRPLLLLVLLAACSERPTRLPVDAGPDAPDGSSLDAAPVDADPVDAGPVDADPPDIFIPDALGPNCFIDEEPSPPPDLDAGPRDALPIYRHVGPGLIVPPAAGCDAPAEATLTLDGAAIDIGRACWAYALFEDGIRTFAGFIFTLAPIDSCDAYVSIGIIHGDRYDQLPVTIDLTEPLCPSSALYNVNVFITRGDDYYSLPDAPTGTLRLEAFDQENAIARGRLDTQLWSERDARLVPMTLDFDIDYASQRPVRIELFVLWANDLCAPP